MNAARPFKTQASILRMASRMCCRYRRPSSQMDRLLQHSFPYVGADRCFGENIHLEAQQVLEVLLNGNDVEQGSSRLHFHEQIQVTIGLRLSPGRRTEYPHVTGSMLRSDMTNLAASVLQNLLNTHGCLPWSTSGHSSPPSRHRRIFPSSGGSLSHSR